MFLCGNISSIPLYGSFKRLLSNITDKKLMYTILIILRKLNITCFITQ